MATRNRTEDFIRLRSTHLPTQLKADSDTSGLLSPGPGHAAVPVPPPKPHWLEHMDNIRSMERHIKLEMEQLIALHKEHLRVQFGVTRDEEREEQDINEKASHIGKLFKTCEQAITDIDVIYRDELGDDGGSDADLAILRNIKLCLINEINGLSRDFRDRQREYLTAIQKQKGIRSAWSGDQQIADREKRDALLSKGCTPDQIETIMLNEEMVQDRNREFQAIYESIKNLHEMFQDLHGMVIEQGTILDRIDYNMTLTEERVTKARKQLQDAAKYQKAGSFKLMLLFLVVLIIGFSVALLLKLSG